MKKEVARTCAVGHRQNTQPWFEEAVQNISFGAFTTVGASESYAESGVRITQAFIKRAMRALSFADTIPHLSDCGRSPR